ncbi:MAG: ZIP family metal transporter [Bacillota bacterium]|nr:ZIP family metal transporter [Bacillota bacterium]
MSWFLSLPAPLQGFLAGFIAWIPATVGAAMVFPFRNVNPKIMNGFLGLAGGIMMAASFFSLLNPSLAYAEDIGINPLIATMTGFIAGVVFLLFADKIFPVNHQNTKWGKRLHRHFGNNTLLILAITLHNIPEGLAIGVAIGAAVNGDTLIAALALAFGIGIQNFPEGAATALPLRRDGLSAKRAFVYSQMSSFVETISAVVGAVLVVLVSSILPYMLSFAAGAMVYVVFAEIIPEAHSNGNKKLVATLSMLGFAIMMFLDLWLG